MPGRDTKQRTEQEARIPERNKGEVDLLRP